MATTNHSDNKPTSADAMAASTALRRLMSMCARREVCEQQARQKLRLWGVVKQEHSEIIATLVEGKYINNLRFARAYAREKLQLSHWGARKVELMLRSKGIADDDIEQALAECADKEEQRESLQHIIEAKKHSLRNETDEYKKKQKLLRFALARGFSYDEIISLL